jgi:hypothetical protein
MVTRVACFLVGWTPCIQIKNEKMALLLLALPLSPPTSPPPGIISSSKSSTINLYNSATVVESFASSAPLQCPQSTRIIFEFLSSSSFLSSPMVGTVFRFEVHQLLLLQPQKIPKDSSQRERHRLQMALSS